MNIFSFFSLRLFGVMTVLFCSTAFDYAHAAGGIAVYHPEEEFYRFAITSYEQNLTRTQKLCAEGYYLFSCGQTLVGTNWLKGIKGAIQTPDYYSYDLPASDPIHVTNLRKFFAGNEPIYFKSDEYEEKVLPSEYVAYRNMILTKFCSNDGKLVGIECKKCPNDAKISASTVKVNESDGVISENSWQVHAITDCYMDEFSDHTGTYVYAPSASAGNTNAAKKCYYSTNVEGSELVVESTTDE